jgi:hypothetical protein
MRVQAGGRRLRAKQTAFGTAPARPPSLAVLYHGAAKPQFQLGGFAAPHRALLEEGVVEGKAFFTLFPLKPSLHGDPPGQISGSMQVRTFKRRYSSSRSP